jgi:Cft2 family RNA processing exonuclease
MPGRAQRADKREIGKMPTGSDALRLISGVGAKGPACFLLEAAGVRIMLDLGEGPPPGLLPHVNTLGPVDALVLSHGHKDHIGGLALLPALGNPPVYATTIVARALPKGIDVRPLPLNGTDDVLGIEVTTGRNGHAPGGIWIHFDVGGGLLYTGDWSSESILYAYDPPAKTACVALVDCSYARHDRSLRDCWNDLAPLVERGPLLLPVPANGRGAEIALALVRAGFADIFVDEAMQKALQRLCNGEAGSLRAGVASEVTRLAGMAKPIDGARGTMLAASADGTAGTAARLLKEWESAEVPAIAFTGYMPPQTPAQRLTKSGRALFVRWNVHPRISDVVALVRAVKPRTVIPAFCDRSQLPGLAEDLAPARVVMDGPIKL